MALNPDTAVPPFPLTAGFTADALSQPLQELVVKLSLSPGSYQLSVLPDLMVLTAAAGGGPASDFASFLREALISYAYVVRTVNWWDASGVFHGGDNSWATLQPATDSLALQAIRDAGYADVLGEPSFYTGDVNIEAAKTITYPSGARDVYTADYYLIIGGWNTSYPLGLSGADVASSGRFLVTSGNPTGQRTQAWGGGWLNIQNVFDVYQPPDVPPLPPPASDLDPANLPASVDWSTAPDGYGVQSPPIADTADAAWWRDAGKTVLSGYASQALTALKELANGLGHADVGAALDIVNAATTAAGVRDFLNGLVAKIWAHDAEGIQLVLDPHVTNGQIADWFGRGTQLDQDAQQASRDQAFSIVGDQVLPGGGTVYSLYTSIPKMASEQDSFALGLTVPGMQVAGGNRSDAVSGGSGADTIRTGAGNDAVMGYAGSDAIATGDGRDWIAGGAGNDQLDGGSGTDTAWYSGVRSSFTTSRTSQGFSVSGSDGTDTLVNIERLQFADVNVALDVNGAGGQAYRLYQAAFNRTPDAGGLGFWIKALDDGAALRDAAQGFVQSDEFRSVYGASPTNAQLVGKYYENVLHRAAEPDGYNYWLSVLDQRADNAAGVLANISESAENQAGVIGAIANGFAYVPWA